MEAARRKRFNTEPRSHGDDAEKAARCISVWLRDFVPSC